VKKIIENGQEKTRKNRQQLSRLAYSPGSCSSTGKGFSAVPILGEALHGLKGVDIYERFHLTHPDCFLFELRVRMMRARQSRKSFAGVCACEAVQKGALFFLFSRSPRRRPLLIFTLGYSSVLLFGQFFLF
jgi:hypothetical protein